MDTDKNTELCVKFCGQYNKGMLLTDVLGSLQSFEEIKILGD